MWEEEKRGERRDRFIFCEVITYWRKTFFDSRENDIFFLYRRVDFGVETEIAIMKNILRREITTERKFNIVISGEDEGVKVGIFLKKNLGFSSSLIKKIKKLPKGIILNDKRAFTDVLLKENDRLVVSVDDFESSRNIVPLQGRLDIVYEDEDIILINKEADVPVHPSKGHPYDSLANRLAFYYREAGENFVFRCVTRLDKDTTGLCLVAKNALAAEILSKDIQKGKIKKTYLAAVEGEIEPDYGIISKNIRRVSDCATIKREICSDEEGVFAETEFRVLQRKNGFSLLEVTPKTGRTHQIRVHLSSEGYPIAGDWLYGKERRGLKGQALHCSRLSFFHPITKEYLSFFVDLPEDIRELFKDM